MTNLAPVLARIQDALTHSGEDCATRKVAALIVLKRDEKGAEIAYIKADSWEEIIGVRERDALETAGLLVDQGRLVTLRQGKSLRVKAVGVKLTELREVVNQALAETSKLVVMDRKIKVLEAELRLMQVRHATRDDMAHLIQSIRDSVSGKTGSAPPTVRFNRSKPTKGRALAGIPSLMLSDWHWGEKVDPAQVEYLNEFDLAIARKRAARVCNTALELLFHHQSGQSYDGYAMILGGDFLSGNIHEELRRTNEATITECLLDLSEVLANNIITAADNFEWVYVPAVAGNHGRLDRKPTSKNAVKENYELLLYNMVMAKVQGKLAGKCNVEFDISEALDMRFNLYNTRYLLTHGDQVEGGSGVGGFWPSMLKTVMRKQQREIQAAREGFDYMVCGHFHKYGAVGNAMVNGSLKGYDEWVYRMNFEHEPPIQSLWTTHPDYGVIDRRPVYAELLEKDNSSSVAPVTTYRNGARGR